MLAFYISTGKQISFTKGLEAGLFALRLGHATALTRPRRVIHSRAAASLPLELPRGSVI